MAINIARRKFIAAFGGAAVAWPLVARAQQPGMPLIGVMSPLSVATAARNLAALRSGLRDLGYTDSQNLKIEYRFPDGDPGRFTALLSELVGLKPAAILVGSNAAVMSAVNATQTIPLIAFMASDTAAAIGKAKSSRTSWWQSDRFLDGGRSTDHRQAVGAASGGRSRLLTCGRDGHSRRGDSRWDSDWAAIGGWRAGP